MIQSQSVSQLFHKSALGLLAAVISIGLLASKSSSYAQTTLVWTANSGDFNNAANWSPAQAPATSDSTLFTNDNNYAVSFAANSPVMDSNTFSNHAGVVTLNIGANKWTVTNNFYVGKADSTSTVYLASGTLSIAGVANSAAQLRIGDATTNLVDCPQCRCVGALIVTNGTVVADGAQVGPTNASVGKLVISGSSTFTYGVSGGTITVGNGSSGSQLIVTNGGKLITQGNLTVGSSLDASNNSFVVSGPASVGSITSGNITYGGNSGSLIISNGAVISTTGGSLLFGNHTSYCTGIVVGTGSKLIVDGSLQVGPGSRGGTNNFLLVQDGAYFSCNGTFAFGNNSFHVGDGVQVGGTGAMSTGVTTFCRTASNITNHYGNFLTVTNAVLASGLMNSQGGPEYLTVLANGTWLFTNSFSLSTGDGPVTSDCVQVRGPGSRLLVDRGTLSNLRVAGDNGGGVSIGGSTISVGTSMLITNGGKLLSSLGTIGGNGIFVTGIVAGVGSVWSNYSGEVGNIIRVGANSGSSNSLNFFAVTDGARLYNNGTLEIGGNATSSVNTVRFGGPGALTIVENSGSISIGASGGTYSNKLIVTNATVTAGALNVGNSGATNNLLEFRGGTINVTVSNMVVRPTNTVLFTAGTLSVVGMRYDTLADPNTNAFVVGDGSSAAAYVMAAGGSGYHNFNDGGLVITNGASLSGSGTLEGKVTVYGTFTPGSIGSLGSIYSSNTLQFGSSAVLNYDLGIPSSDTVTVNGSLILGGVVNVGSVTGFGAGTYTLMTHTGTVSGTLSVGAMPPGFSGTISNDLPTTPRILLVVTAGGGDAYSTWANYYGLSGASALGTADPDGDGMSNTNEFLTGFNPTNSSARLKIISIARTDGTNSTITYLGANGDSNGSAGPKTNVLDSTTGAANGSYSNNWTSTGLTNILTGGNGLGQVATFVHTNGATGATRYYRVRVLVP
jgi:fibronectin-binding autotransporter adhesin